MFGKDKITFEDAVYEAIETAKTLGLEENYRSDNGNVVGFGIPCHPGIRSQRFMELKFTNILGSNIPTRLELGYNAEMRINGNEFEIAVGNSQTFGGMHSDTIEMKKWTEVLNTFKRNVITMQNEAQDLRKRTKQFSLNVEKMLAAPLA